MTKKELMQKCELIARQNKVKLTWVDDGVYGYYIPNTNKIAVTSIGTKRQIISVFCHEMGHVMNFRNKKYYKYHRHIGKKYTRKFKTKHAAVVYALKAEIYTDTVGKRLCKNWFPDIKFVRNYKMNNKFYNYMYENFI